MANEFNLPGSSFEEIQKILKGYSHAPEQASLETLSKLIGLHSTVISRNNKFLTDIGLISGGMKKSATDLGKKMGRALDHHQESDAQRYWREAVQTNEKVSGLVTTVRIKGGMSERDFSNHVLYVSGQKNNSGNKTGARCVVDVLLAAGLLAEENGKLVVTTPSSEMSAEEPVAEAVLSSFESPAQSYGYANVAPPAHVIPNLVGMPQIAINIQLHLPETENAEVYEKLFKALRDNLINPQAS